MFRRNLFSDFIQPPSYKFRKFVQRFIILYNKVAFCLTWRPLPIPFRQHTHFKSFLFYRQLAQKRCQWTRTGNYMNSYVLTERDMNTFTDMDMNTEMYRGTVK